MCVNTLCLLVGLLSESPPADSMARVRQLSLPEVVVTTLARNRLFLALELPSAWSPRRPEHGFRALT